MARLTRALVLATLGMIACPWPAGAASPTPSDPDQRQVLELPPDERHLVLQEMRSFLEAMQEITAGLAEKDMERVSEAARRMGGRAANAIPPRVVAKLPDTFRRLAGKVHTTFDRIALDAGTMADRQLTLEQLRKLQRHCVACHATYQIEKVPFDRASRSDS